MRSECVTLRSSARRPRMSALSVVSTEPMRSCSAMGTSLTLASVIADLRLVTSPSAGHFIPWEEPGTVTQAIAITVTNVNEAPLITSAAAVSVAENQTAVTTVTSSDVDGGAALYSIVGGVDAARIRVVPSGIDLGRHASADPSVLRREFEALRPAEVPEGPPLHPRVAAAQAAASASPVGSAVLAETPA